MVTASQIKSFIKNIPASIAQKLTPSSQKASIDLNAGTVTSGTTSSAPTSSGASASAAVTGKSAPVSTVTRSTRSGGGGGGSSGGSSSVGGNQLSLTPAQALAQDQAQVQVQQQRQGITNQQRASAIQRQPLQSQYTFTQDEDRGTVKTFSGSVAESFRGQPQQTSYYVGGEQTGRTYQQDGQTYAETVKPSTFTFQKGRTQEAVQFTNEGMSSASLTEQDVASIISSETQKNYAMISGVPKTGNIYADAISNLGGKSQVARGYYGESKLGIKGNLVQAAIFSGISLLGTGSFFNAIFKNPAKTIVSIPASGKATRAYLKSGSIETLIRTNPSGAAGYLVTEGLTAKGFGYATKPFLKNVANSGLVNKGVNKIYNPPAESIVSISLERTGKGGRSAVVTGFETSEGRQGIIKQVAKIGEGRKSYTAFVGEVYDLKYSGKVYEPEFIPINRQTFVGGIKSQSGKGTAKNIIVQVPGFEAFQPVKIEAYVGKGRVASAEGNIIKPSFKIDRYGNLQIGNVIKQKAQRSLFYSKAYSLPTGEKRVSFILGGTKLRGEKNVAGFAGYNFRINPPSSKKSLGTITKSGKSYLILSPQQQLKLLNSQKVFNQMSVASAGVSSNKPITLKSVLVPVPSVNTLYSPVKVQNVNKGITGNVISSYSPKLESQFYGTGQYERSGGGQTPTFATSFKTFVIQNQPSISRSRSGQISMTAQLEDLGLKNRQNIIQSPSTITRTDSSLKFNQRFRQDQGQRFRQIQITTQLNPPNTPTRLRFNPPRPKVPKLSSQKAVQGYSLGGVKLFVKEKGQFKFKGLFKDVYKASETGKFLTGSSINRSYKITGAVAPLLQGYRTSKKKGQQDVFVELSKTALSQPYEQKAVKIGKIMKGGTRKKRR